MLSTEVISTAFLVYPIVVSEPRNRTVLEGTNARFDCEVGGRPRPRTFWLWRNKTINQLGARKLSNGSLLLPSVENNVFYEGRYSCFAENAAGKSGRSVRYLTVHGKFSGKYNTVFMLWSTATH